MGSRASLHAVYIDKHFTNRTKKMTQYAMKKTDLSASSTVPAATYRFRVNKAEINTVEAIREKKPDSRIEDDQLNLDLVVQDEGDFFGRHVFENLSLSGQFSWRARKFLDAIEYPDDEDLDTEKMVDAEFYGVVKVQPASVGKDGKEYDERNQVSKFIGLNETLK